MSRHQQAGELATEYGLTNWAEGDALDAAVYAFKLWRGHRGEGNDEKRKVLEQVSGFIDRHGDGRFSDAESTFASTLISNRAGWWRDTKAGRVYLLTADGMRDAIKGFELSQALKVLQSVGALPPATNSGERSKPQRIGGRSVRLYQIDPEKLAA